MPRARIGEELKVLLKAVATVCALTLGQAAHAASWDDTLAQARGQTVYWHAWGGDPQINAYIEWVGDQVQERHGVDVVHVKLTDTAEAVARVVAEKTAGKTEGGAVDLIWINGENFASMKEQDLLSGPFVQDLPNFRHVDTAGKPTTLVDFTVPTGGLEAPWGMAQFVFLYDTAAVDAPPRSMPALLEWIKAHPGRFTYPAPPDFIGSTFLKHVVAELTDRPEALQSPVDQADFAAVTAPLWAWLEEARPISGAKAQAIRCPARRSISCSTTARSTSPWRSIRPKRRPRSPPAGCPRRCAPSSWRTAPSATPISSRSRSTPRTRPARWWSPTS